MENYSPTYNFNGTVTAANAPSGNNDLVRKQDVEGLSFISSIASGSSDFISVSNGELSVSNLLVTDVKVDTTQTSLTNYVANAASSAALGVGDIVILTAPTDTEMYIVKSNSGTATTDYEEITSSLSAAQIVALLDGGTGIDIAADGTISFNGDTDDVTEGSTNLYHTAARARASVSVTDAGGDGSLAYNSSTGVFTYTGPSSSEVRNHFSSGNGLSLSDGEFAVSLGENDPGLGFDGTGLAINYDDSTIGCNESGALEFKGNTDDVNEGSTNLYHTTARARAAFSASTGIDITAGAISFNPAFLRYDEEDVSLVADTAYTVSHNLSEKYVIVQVYDSSDNLIQVDVSLTSTSACTVTSASALTGCYIVVKR